MSAVDNTLDRATPAFVPAMQAGNLIFTSGQLPLVDGTLAATGKVGRDIDSVRAAELAEVCTRNALGVLESIVGDLDRVRVVKVVGFVASVPEFTGQPAVIDAASRLLTKVLGERGSHARSAVGVAALPLDAPVEVELIAEIVG
ncbi:RidA family protein [Rhodococcus sovatensis]|uniref:RidA family protein n=1 Tax=Rhodococcus sovatensis TaxID=1805840 RepID=A0ABZ2PHY5_9NOCA